MSIVSIDEVVRAICGTQHRQRFAELSNAIMRDLDAEQISALVSAHALDGNPGATALLAVWLKGGRLWVRLRPVSKRQTHVFEGHSFLAGRWYSVPRELGERLRDEPVTDLPSKFVALFEVESQAPKGESVETLAPEWIW